MAHDIFADTSGWGHLLDPSQRHHASAAAIYRTAARQGCKVITTNYVIAELVALFYNPLRIPRPQVIALLDSLHAADHVEIVHIDAALDAQALALLKARPDKEWSLADCASFVVMQQRGLTEALTALNRPGLRACCGKLEYSGYH